MRPSNPPEPQSHTHPPDVETTCASFLICLSLAAACILVPALSLAAGSSPAPASSAKAPPGAALLLLETIPLHLALICAVVIPAALFKQHGEKLLEKLCLKMPTLSQAAIALGIEALLFPCIMAITLLTKLALSLFHSGLGGSQLIVKQALLASPAGFAVVFFTAAILAPVAEELAFRRTIFRFLQGVAGTLPAMLASSALFAASHCSLTQFPAFFLLGLTLQWLFLRWNSLTPAIMLHCLHNSISMALLLILRLHPIKTLDF